MLPTVFGFSSDRVMKKCRSVPNCYLFQFGQRAEIVFPTVSLFQFGKCDDRFQECLYGGVFPTVSLFQFGQSNDKIPGSVPNCFSVLVREV